MKTGSILIKAFALIIITAIMSSCGSKTPNTINAIPKDAAFIMCIDGGAIADKSGVEDITQTQIFQKIQAELSSDELESLMEFENIIKNPTESGVAMNKESFMFVTSFDDDATAGFVVELQDEEKFKTILKTQFEKNEVDIDFEDKEGVTILVSKEFEDDICLAWKDGVLLFLGHDSRDEGLTKQMAINLLNNTKENSIASIENFNDFYKGKKDISLWMSYEPLMEAQKKLLGFYGQMINLDFSDSYMHSFLSFEKGKVEMEVTTVLNDKLTEMYRDFPYMKEGVDDAILAYMPEPSLLSFSFGLDATNLYKFAMELMGETIKAQAGLFDTKVQDELGMNIEEALATIGGDLIVNVHGFETETYERIDYQAYSESDGTKDIDAFMVTKTSLGMPKFSASFSIVDDKIIDILLEKAGSDLVDLGGYYSMGDGDELIYIVYHNKQIFLSNDEALIKAYKAGEEVENSLADSDMAKLISKQGAYYAINLDMDSYPQEMIDALKSDMDEEEFSIFKNVMSLYEKVEFIPNGTYSGSCILWLKNDKANSLKQIVHNADESISLID